MSTRHGIASLAVFVCALTVYLANGRALGAGDTLPARYLPFSILREHDFDLDEFPFLYDAAARRNTPLLDGVPYFLHRRKGHYLSAYSPGPAILALPLYAAPVLAGVPATEWAEFLEKLSAAAITALSVVALFLALIQIVDLGWALVLATIYALGTSSWSISSQALWQHGPSQLFIALVVLCLVRGMRDQRWLPYAGFCASAAAVIRSTDVLIAAPVVAWILLKSPRHALRVCIFAIVPLAGILLYNIAYFDSVTGPAGNTAAPAWAFFVQGRPLESLGGLLVSPGRGLFVYSPVLVFSIVGMLWALWRGPGLVKPLALGVLLVVLVLSRWFRWWGGHSWGPRLLADTTPILCFFLYPLPGLLDRQRIAKAT